MVFLVAENGSYGFDSRLRNAGLGEAEHGKARFGLVRSGAAWFGKVWFLFLTGEKQWQRKQQQKFQT